MSEGINVALQHEPTTDVVVTTVATPLAPTNYSSSSEYNDMVLSLLHQSARSGDVESQCKLGAMYACGDGVPRSYPVALQFMRRAADRGHPLALYNLAVMHARGYGVD